MNLSLQALLGEVARSFEEWSTAGIFGLKCAFVGLKGDWKFLVQALSLKFTPSSDQICFLCPASKSLRYPYTDLSLAARWRTETHQEDVWFAPPAVLGIPNFHLGLVCLDILHIFHLGLGRDLVAGVMVVLLRSRAFFQGSKAGSRLASLCPCQVEQRMQDASRLAKQWSRAHGEKRLPNRWHFSKSRLSLKSGKYAHFTGKAWHTAVVIQWLCGFFEDGSHRAEFQNLHASLFVCLWCANNMMSLVHSARAESFASFTRGSGSASHCWRPISHCLSCYPRCVQGVVRLEVVQPQTKIPHDAALGGSHTKGAKPCWWGNLDGRRLDSVHDDSSIQDAYQNDATLCSHEISGRQGSCIAISFS